MNAKQAMNATLNIIMKSKSLNDYHLKLKKYKPKELGFIQECFALLYFKGHGLPEQDLGTDGVILHNDGEVSLVQVKWRTNKSVHNRSVFYGLAIDALECSVDVKHLILFSNSINITNTLPKCFIFLK